MQLSRRPADCIEDITFMSHSEDGTAILRGHPNHAKVQPFAGCAMVLPSFPSYFKTLRIGPVFDIEPSTSCAAVRRSTISVTD